MNVRAALQLRHLRALAAIAESQHMGRAAQRLAISQPALSKTLRELEDLSECCLVQRGRSGARLTAAGESLLPHALAALRAVGAAADSLRPGAADDRRGLLHLGVLPSVGPAVVPAALLSYMRSPTAARVELLAATNDQLLALLRSGRVDLAVGRLSDPAQMAGLSFEFLYADPLVFVVRPGHPLAARAAGSGDDLLDAALNHAPLLLAPEGTLPRHASESLLKSRGRSLPAQRVETLAPEVARALCLTSDAVWLTPLGAVRAELARAGLCALAIDTRGSEEPVGLLQRTGAAMQAAADAADATAVMALAEALRMAAAQWRAGATAAGSTP